jgi:hypothetical protein
MVLTIVAGRAKIHNKRHDGDILPAKMAAAALTDGQTPLLITR